MSTLRGTVPFVVSYRKVNKRPEIKTERKFVGIRQMYRNLVGMVLNAVEDVAYETDTVIDEEGLKTKVVHWAVNVDDPWGINDTASMVATRLPEKPACGMHYEIVMIDESLEFPIQTPGGINGSGVASRPENHEDALARMRDALKREGHFDPEVGLAPAS
jgi:hypothetical protein